MTLELMKQEQYEEGKQETIALFAKILSEAEKQNVKVDYSKLQNMEYIDELCRILKISK